MLSEKDTIVACSSPPGRGAISVIRLSGDKAFSIIQKITKNKLKKQISVVKFPLNYDLIEFMIGLNLLCYTTYKHNLNLF